MTRTKGANVPTPTEREIQVAIVRMAKQLGYRYWLRFWRWIDGMNHDDNWDNPNRRRDENYPVIGCPRFYWLCSLADWMTRGWAHD